MNKLEIKRMKFTKERKKKLHLFYYEVRCYFEDAYRDFEQKYLLRKADKDYKEPTSYEWLEYHKDYRKSWKLKPVSSDMKRYSAIKEGSKELFNQAVLDNYMTQQT